MRLALFACVWLSAACDGRSTAPRIGVIDMTAALRSSKAGRAATDRLKEAHARRQQALDEKQASLKERLATLRAAQPPSKESQALQDELVALQGEFERMTQAMNAEQTSAIEGLMPPLGKAIEAVAAERKLEVVLDAASVLYRGETVDITQECVRRLDTDSKQDR